MSDTFFTSRPCSTGGLIMCLGKLLLFQDLSNIVALIRLPKSGPFVSKLTTSTISDALGFDSMDECSQALGITLKFQDS